MPNNYWRNQTDANFKGAGGASNEPSGSEPSTSMPEKAVGYPGVPGKTQPGNRSGGAPTTGYAGPFYIDKEGL